MKAQQLLDYFIIPTLRYMGGGYDSLNSRVLLVSTAAMESNCGYKWVQDGGPALSPWQIEPKTHHSILANCDALRDSHFLKRIMDLKGSKVIKCKDDSELISYPHYACAIARLKFAMDKFALPDHNDKHAMFDYYKRVYNTAGGDTTRDEFIAAWGHHNISKLRLT